jgi:GNAT superfamily N-acetyltransferase
VNSALRLTREVIDQIVFGMENQDRDYYLDTDDATVVPEDQIDEEQVGERYLIVPEWRSVDGYNLMEQFVATLHNPIYRARLRAILASGRGVFRQFKDTVRERREIERLWFTFKERRMRELVIDWFNDVREREGLERLEELPAETETDQLIRTDFVFRPARPEELKLVEDLDRKAFTEAYPDADEQTVGLYYEQFRAGLPPVSAPTSSVRIAETQGGDFAGFLWAVRRRTGETSVAFVQQIYTIPDFRGFGLARELWHGFCRELYDEQVGEVQLPLHGAAQDLEPNFVNYGLTRQCTMFTLDVAHWHRSQIG